MDTTGSTSQPPEDAAAGVLDLVALLLRHPRALFAFPLAVAVLVVALCLVIPGQYTAVATFVPEVSSDQRLPAGLAGVAGQLGLNLGGGATTSPRFFVDVLKSRGIMERALQTPFAVPGDSLGATLPLLQLLHVSGDSPADSLQNGTKAMANIVRIQVDAETNILTLRVTTESRVLSAAVANALVGFLDDFNTETRQSKGRERRRFVEARLGASAEELAEAELSLKEFYDRNRRWQQSPDLTFREGRLRRAVDVKQEVYLTLAREFEKAQIDEVNDTPGITVIDPAVPIESRSYPRPALFGLMSLVVSFVIGVGWVVMTEFFARLKASDPNGYARLVSAVPKFSRRSQ